MSNSNKPASYYISRIIGGIAFLWFFVFLIYGGFIAKDTLARGISAIFCGIGLTTAMVCAFWDGAVSHHKGGGEDLK